MGREIERKWLFPSLNDAVQNCRISEYYTYMQGYLSTEPEVRISCKQPAHSDENICKLTIKSVGNLDRIEVEKVLTSLEFLELLEVGNLTLDDLIHKDFIQVCCEGYDLTIGQVDKGLSTSFFYGEIEFPSVEDANEFKAPKWFGKEVTNDRNYKMVEYWKRTRKGETK